MNAIDNFLLRLPEAHRGWACKWFWTICWLSLILVALGLTVLPDLWGTGAIILGSLSFGLAVGQRRPKESCDL